MVEHVAHAGDVHRDVLGQPPRPAVGDPAFERDVPVADLHADLPRIEARVGGEPVAQVLEDPLVGASVVARPAARVRAGTEGDVALDAFGNILTGDITAGSIDLLAGGDITTDDLTTQFLEVLALGGPITALLFPGASITLESGGDIDTGNIDSIDGVTLRVRAL